MNTLHEATFPDLSALLDCLDHLERDDPEEASRRRHDVYAELRRRFAMFDENMKMMEATRAAREASRNP